MAAVWRIQMALRRHRFNQRVGVRVAAREAREAEEARLAEEARQREMSWTTVHSKYGLELEQVRGGGRGSVEGHDAGVLGCLGLREVVAGCLRQLKHVYPCSSLQQLAPYMARHACCRPQ
jgi:hypothetical protein